MPSATRLSAVGRWAGTIAVSLGVLAVGLDNYALLTALPALSRSLHVHQAEGLQWVMTAYTLGWVCFFLPAKRLCDRFGHRRLLVTGLLVFGGSSGVGAEAGGIGELVPLRAAMGAGAALISGATLAALAETPAEGARSLVLAPVRLASALGMPLGWLGAGYLVDHFWWGSVLVADSAMAGLALTALLCTTRGRALGRARTAGSGAEGGAGSGAEGGAADGPAGVAGGRAVPVDWAGATLMAACLTALSYGLINGPTAGWCSWPVHAALAVSAVALCALLVHEAWTPAPLLDLGLLSDRRLAPAVLAPAVASLALFGTLFLLAPFLRSGGYSGGEGEGDLLLLAAGVIVGGAASYSLLAGSDLRRTLTTGLLVAGLGQLVLARLRPGDGRHATVSALLLLGTGLGMVFAASRRALLVAVPFVHWRAGDRLQRWGQVLGASLGCTVFGSALNPPAGDRAAVARALTPGDAYTSGMSWALLWVVGVLLLSALIIAVLMPSGERWPPPPYEYRSTRPES